MQTIEGHCSSSPLRQFSCAFPNSARPPNHPFRTTMRKPVNPPPLKVDQLANRSRPPRTIAYPVNPAPQTINLFANSFRVFAPSLVQNRLY